MRFILYLIASVLILSLLRSVVGMISKGFADLFAPPTTGGTERPRSTVPNAEELKKDPVCGTFIAVSSSVQRTINGKTYYFCSAACRDLHKSA